MAPSEPQEGGKRPNPLRPTKSFPRAEAQDANTAKSRSQRANTIQNGAAGDPVSRKEKENVRDSKGEEPDTFESMPAEDPPAPPRASVDLEDLPIELIGLTDSFVESLSAKVHNVPPNIDNLSRKFQDFYAQAAAHINTHIAAMMSRQSREQSPAPTLGSRGSAASILRTKAASIGNRDKANTPPPKQEVEQQMLTAVELAERKKARKSIEQKRGHYEEAVERRLCEGIYSRIYRHRTTSDEAQDDKLRSKTAALAVVGIGPADLGVHLGELSSETPEGMLERQEEVRNWLGQARKELVLMNASKYPLGKLNRLKSAHKAIVDTLAHFHPSSSADEIMPMLIYTLITLPPENLNVISDLNFIQRFRWEQKIEGEAAYCLTNLEAAIVFLDTVDLSTLRADEAPSGPMRMPSKPGTPSTETFPPAYAAASHPGISAESAVGLKASPAAAGLKAVQLRNRRFSDLVNTPAQALTSASDAVLNTFNAADQGIKTIGTSLEGSYKLFFSKFSKQADEPTARGGEAPIAIPKTLEDARKLIGTPPPNDDDGTASGASSLHSPEDERHRPKTTRDDRTLSLLVGNRGTPVRDHSADSSRSVGSSGRKTGFFGAGGASAGTMTYGADETRKEGVVTPLGAAADSIRNLGSSLNPMSRLSAGIGGFRGFGRTPPPAASVPTTTPPSKETARAAEGGDLATAFPDLAAALPPKPQIDPPKQRFVELQNPADLRIGEVLELLRDYRRLANALSDRQAFKGQ